MIIDDSMIQEYLGNNNVEKYCNHWVFSGVIEEKKVFESPNIEFKKPVANILNLIKSMLLDFHPMNENIFTNLFPTWMKDLEDFRILLTVGMPNPYDAMVRSHEGKEYVVFDLIRFHDYELKGFCVEDIVSQMITHEAAHICLHKKYSLSSDANYEQTLKYITFDEGFAHFIAFKEDIENYDADEVIGKYYDENIKKLRESFKENDLDRQEELLEVSNSGPYWEKFAAISGKLFLLKHIDDYNNLYNQGVDNFIKKMKVLE